MKRETITTVNFGGFYESSHSYNIDNYIEDRNLELSDTEYKALEIEYCKEYINKLNYYIDTNLQFKKLNSPSYYNFSTDVIDVIVSNKDLLAISKYIEEFITKEYKKEMLRDIIKEYTTQRDGYIPYYSYKDFFKKDNKALLFECYLDLLLKETDIEDNILYDIDLNY